MDNNDPLRAYAQSMQQVTASDQLKQRTFASATHAGDVTSQTATNPISHTKRPRVPQAIAACLALVLAIGGTTAIASTAAAPFATPEGSDKERVATTAQNNALGGLPLFGETLQAYAATTDTLVPANENGELLLSRTMEAGLLPENLYQQYGYYTGCLLAIDVDNLSSVSFSISKGQLYQGQIETFVVSSDPRRWKDALTWKCGIDQSASSYSTYDFVQPLANLDGKSKEDPSKECRVETDTLLGSSATIDSSAAAHSFVGIWTNEPYDGLTDDPYNATILTLDGAYLTIAYTYEDGTSAQAVYELQATCVEVDYSGNAIVATSREVSPDDTSVSSTYTLKAVPVSAKESH